MPTWCKRLPQSSLFFSIQFCLIILCWCLAGVLQLSVPHNVFPFINFFILGKHKTVLQSKKKTKHKILKRKRIRWENSVLGVWRWVGWPGVKCCVTEAVSFTMCVWKNHSTTLTETLLVLDPVHPDTPSFPTASSATDSRTFVKS